MDKICLRVVPFEMSLIDPPATYGLFDVMQEKHSIDIIFKIATPFLLLNRPWTSGQEFKQVTLDG